MNMRAAKAAELLSSDFWKREKKSDEMIESLKRYFYPEFVDFNYKTCTRYYHLFEHLKVKFISHGKVVPFEVKGLHLYMMPCDILLFSISIGCTSTDLNDFSDLAASLRNIQAIKSLDDNYMTQVITPLCELKSKLTGQAAQPRSLVELGNKLKLFQIIDAPETIADKASRDTLLLQLGTCSPIETNAKKDSNSMSPEYMESLLAKSRLSFFNSWSALALLDTFTIFSFGTNEWLLKSWGNDYFGMIYLHSLFVKFYLQRLNYRFRSDQSKAIELEDDFENFESRYCFNKISYNFLPIEIAKATDRALELSDEQQSLYKVINVEKQRQEDANAKMLNNTLLFLTLISVFSAVWDTTCLMEQLFGFGDSKADTMSNYRLVVEVLFSVIIVVVLLLFRNKLKIGRTKGKAK